ncbi:MAG: PilZ domain-containing protein [Vicinamibacterales bacterium]
MSTKTIVVADDTAFVRERFATTLSEAGLNSIAVASMPELLACLKPDAARIHLVVLDLHLGPRRGEDLVRMVMERAGQDVPVVIFSGTIANAAEARAVAAMGVAGYVNEYCAQQHILPSLAPHLYPDKFDRRSSARVNVALSVSYRVANQIASGLSLNLGKGGIGIRTMSPIEVGAQARVRFRLPGDVRDIEADARVMWADRNLGMGLQFERLNMTDQAAIDDFVDGHFFANRRA